jgi:hypothetical protein
MDKHSITPPSELVQQWGHDANLSGVPYDDETGHWAYEQHIATRAAQYGADQELEACCEWLPDVGEMRAMLRAARRPKPPSLKQQALEALERMHDTCLMSWDNETIRRALEALPE